MPDLQIIPDVPFRMIFKASGDFDGELCCPLCGHEYVHPERVSVEQGHSRTVVTGETTEISTSSRSLSHRGSLINLRFWCEQGHSFQYDLEFHKGNVQARLSAARRTGPFQPAELWRD